MNTMYRAYKASANSTFQPEIFISRGPFFDFESLYFEQNLPLVFANCQAGLQF